MIGGSEHSCQWCDSPNATKERIYSMGAPSYRREDTTSVIDPCPFNEKRFWVVANMYLCSTCIDDIRDKYTAIDLRFTLIQ